jgi:hypothetical protein
MHTYVRSSIDRRRERGRRAQNFVVNCCENHFFAESLLINPSIFRHAAPAAVSLVAIYLQSLERYTTVYTSGVNTQAVDRLNDTPFLLSFLHPATPRS